MIKGILLGINMAVFLVASIFTLAGFTENLQENIITGASINASELTNYSLAAMLISLVASLILILFISKNYKSKSRLDVV